MKWRTFAPILTLCVLEIVVVPYELNSLVDQMQTPRHQQAVYNIKCCNEATIKDTDTPVRNYGMVTQ
jgi:hypothetical protein